jgi:hypothetical protein
VGPPGINVDDWEVCHREIRITVLSKCPDTFDQVVYMWFRNSMQAHIPVSRTYFSYICCAHNVV